YQNMYVRILDSDSVGLRMTRAICKEVGFPIFPVGRYLTAIKNFVACNIYIYQFFLYFNVNFLTIQIALFFCYRLIYPDFGKGVPVIIYSGTIYINGGICNGLTV